MNKIEEATIYAIVMHQGKVRRMGSIPHILRPLEVAQILATVTSDQNVIIAGILHDIVAEKASLIGYSRLVRKLRK